jgi:hypothetical protein
VVREGEITCGHIVRASTQVYVAIAIADGTCHYQLPVPLRPRAELPAGERVRVLVAGDAPFAILLAPTGDEQVVYRVGPRGGRRSRLPPARLIRRAITPRAA